MALAHRSRSLSVKAVLLSALVVAGTLVGLSNQASASTSPTLSIFAGNGSTGAPTAGPALSSPSQGTAALAFDSAGNLYTTDPNADVVTKITPSGTQSIVAGISGSAGAAAAGPATSSHLQHPYGVTVDSTGNVFIADSDNNRVEKVTPSGTLSFVAGTGVSGTPVPGSAASSPLGEPSAITVDSADNLYVANYNTLQVLKITPSGTLSIFAGNGIYGTPVAGPATSTPTGGSFGLGVDKQNNLLIADYDKCVIEKVTPAGTLSIAVGNLTCSTEVPGPATSSPVGYLYGGLSVDFQNNIYYSSSSNNTLIRVAADGTLSKIAGTNSVSGAPTPGPAASSLLDGSYATAIDAQGNVYVADYGNKVIEKITVATAPSAPTSATATLTSGNPTISWTAPAFGDAATSYTITPTVNGIAGTPITGVTALSYTVSSPVAGATYSFTVTAVNANGSSPASTASNTVTAATPPPTTTTTMPPTTTTTVPTTSTTVVPPTSGLRAPIHVGTDGTVTNVPVFNSPNPATQLTASTSTGAGSWTLAPDGGIFTAGDAGFYGSHGGSPMNAPAAGIAPTVSGTGYLVVGADGGVFAYGTAGFKGSMGGKPLNAPVTGIASTCSSNGYYLVANDGGVFGFGDAGFYGSMAGKPLNQGMIGIVDSCGQNGYWTFAKDGGVFTFGNAHFYGSLASKTPTGGVIGMVSAPDGKGYWLIGADKKAYGFGSVAN